MPQPCKVDRDSKVKGTRVPRGLVSFSLVPKLKKGNLHYFAMSGPILGEIGEGLDGSFGPNLHGVYRSMALCLMLIIRGMG